MRAPGAPTQYGRMTKRPGSKRELVCIETAGLHRAFNHCRRGLRLAPPKPACHAVMPLWRRRATAGPAPPPALGPAHAAHRGPRGRAARARAGTQGLPSQPRSRPLRPPPGAAVCAPHGTAAGPVRLTLTLHCAPERARLASPARARRTRPPGRRSPAARPAARSRPRRARWARALRGAPGLALALPVGGARAPAPRLWQQDYGRRASVQRRPCRSTNMAAHPCT